MGNEISRKLASIQKIESLSEIVGADQIEVARVLGWDVVVKKGEFEVGDLAVYFEIDSFLPRRPEWEFLEKSSLCKMGDKEGLRLRTIKLRGQISQGLLLPIKSIFEPSEEYPGNWEYTKALDAIYHGDRVEIPFETEVWDLEDGDDLTKLLDVIKWDPPVPARLAGKVRGNFPSFLRKTDQERIQNCYRTLQNKWLNHFWEVSIKLDGSSFTAYYNAETDQFGVCSRNLDLAESGENAFWQVARKYGLETKMREHGISIAIQGELIGPGIQGNPEGLAELDMYVFDIFDVRTQRYFASLERQLLTEYFGLNHVPVIDIVQLHECKLEDILEFADGPSLYAKRREGIVFKSLDDPNVSWKAISNQWLLKNEG